jgi:hypothetical protein
MGVGGVGWGGPILKNSHKVGSIDHGDGSNPNRYILLHMSEKPFRDDLVSYYYSTMHYPTHIYYYYSLPSSTQINFYF